MQQLKPISTNKYGWYVWIQVLLVCALTTLELGCPVYELVDLPVDQRCEPGEAGFAVGSAPVAPCPCEGKVKMLTTGEAIPGMDDGSIPRRGGELVIHLDANLPSLNRLKNNDAWIKRIVHHDVYQALVRLDPKTYEIMPELATDWQSDESGTEWRFVLREGVTWHDGEPFTAQDVKFTFDTFLNPQNRTEIVRGDWQDVLDPRHPYEAPDDYTFIIRLKKPLALFLNSLEDLTIIPAHIFSRGDFNTHPNLRIPIGTGPYHFVEWSSDAMVFERNPDYWGRPAYLDRLIYRIVTDRDTAFAMLKRGDLGFMPRLMSHHRSEGITADLLERYRLIDFLPSNHFGFWIFNTKRPQFADKRTRQAMSLLIDRKQIICEIYQCLAKGITGPTPRSHPGYDHSIVPYTYDPSQAAKLLSEAGWEDRDGDGVREKEIDGKVVPFSVTFMLTQGSRSQEQVVTVVQNAARRVGVDIRITKIDWSVFTDRMRKFDFDLTSFIYIVNHEPDQYGIFHSAGAQNFGKWHNEEMDSLTDRSRYIPDHYVRAVLLRRMHQILHEEQPYAFTYVQALPALILKDIRGVYTSDEWYQEYDFWLNDPSLPEVPPEERHPGHPGALAPPVEG